MEINYGTLFVEIIEALTPLLSIIVAGFGVFVGYRAWQREFVGKKKIDLAEKVLALFYEVEDAIRFMRNPMSLNSEGKSRNRNELETELESRFLDQAYVIQERYQKKEKLFSKFNSMRYRVMATFGTDAEEPFKEVEKVLRTIFSSTWLLGTYLWPRQGKEELTEKEWEKHHKELQKHQAIFWYMGAERDEVGKQIHAAVETMEAITQEAAFQGKKK